LTPAFLGTESAGVLEVAERIACSSTPQRNAPHTLSRKDWLHREARCLECRLHLDPHLDLDEHIRVNSDTRATGAIVTHRRYGRTFRIVFSD